MARQQLPPTAYVNPRWRGEVWDRYTPSDSSTEYYTQGEGEEEDTSTVSESDLDVAGSAFPEWKDIKQKGGERKRRKEKRHLPASLRTPTTIRRHRGVHR